MSQRDSQSTPLTPDQCTCPSGDGSLRWPCPVHRPSNTNLAGMKVLAEAWGPTYAEGKLSAWAVAEIERLTRERDTWRGHYQDLLADAVSVRQEMIRRDAERARLRAALSELSQWCRPDEHSPPEHIAVHAQVDALLAGSPVETEEKRAYYETHDPPHCPTCGCGLPREDACSCGRVELKDGYVRATCADGSVHTKGGCNSPSKALPKPRHAYSRDPCPCKGHPLNCFDHPRDCGCTQNGEAD